MGSDLIGDSIVSGRLHAMNPLHPSVYQKRAELATVF